MVDGVLAYYSIRLQITNKEEVLLQLYTPADTFSDLQTWCYTPSDCRPSLTDKAWYILQGEVFGQGLPGILPYLRFGNEKMSGMRLVIHDPVIDRVSAVGLYQARTATDWNLAYYYAITGCQRLRVWETAQPTLFRWLAAEAKRQQQPVRLSGAVACSEDGCQLQFAYWADQSGRVQIEQDEVSYN